MKIKELYTYPIKSLRGCSLSSLPATYQGFAHDRRFMLIRASDKKNMHVAHFPEMCLFTTEIEFDDEEAGGKIVVSFNPPSQNDFSPGQTEKSSIDIPLQPDVQQLELEKEEITMHSSPTVGFNMGNKYNEWLSERFGYGVILLYLGSNRREVLGGMPPNVAGRIQREKDQQQKSNRESQGWLSSVTSSLPSIPIFGNRSEGEEYAGVDEGISFADCAPYLVISTKSWESAQARLPEGEDMDISKFRPNIVVEGADKEFEEDFWGELEIIPRGEGSSGDDNKENASASKEGTGVTKIVLTQNCARCNSLNVDYATGKVGTGEAGKILKKLQSDRRVDPGSKYSPIFGRYGFLDRIEDNGRKSVVLRVGDEVKVGKWNKERTTWLWPNLGTPSN